ncbi:MAG: thiamine diphosphokinase [Lachnospiraceae bacterium]|nr:thiamine diphosphokinase [Lachnospiraceae bacterium]
MKENICYVVGAGENYGIDFKPASGDYVIAADAGLRYLEKQGIRTDLVIGDFDTLKCIPEHPNTMVLSPEKDDTDTLAAVREGIKAGYSSFHIYCGTGGRIDHTMANLQVLAYLSANNMRGFLFDNGTVITAITNDRLCFEKIPFGYVSVFSGSTKAKGVTLCGLKYELNNAVLTNTFPIGVSNEFIDRESSISVSDGTLFIVFPREAKERIIQ